MNKNNVCLLTVVYLFSWIKCISINILIYIYILQIFIAIIFFFFYSDLCYLDTLLIRFIICVKSHKQFFVYISLQIIFLNCIRCFSFEILQVFTIHTFDSHCCNKIFVLQMFCSKNILQYNFFFLYSYHKLKVV